MDVLKVEALLCAVERGSFTAAAEELGYTPSGVTRMVDALEAELGFSLVSRGRNGVQLTRDGASLMPQMRAFARGGAALSEQAAQIRGIVEGEVRISSYFSIAANWLPPVIASFQRSHPDVRIVMTSGGNSRIAQDLAENRVDCCFTSKRMATGEWVPLRQDPLVAWVPNMWPEAQLAAFPLSQIERLPFIMPVPGTNNDFEALFKERGIAPRVTLASDDNFTAWRLVEAGLGISGNNLLMSAAWTGDVAVLPFEPAQSIELGVAVRDLRAASPATRAFIEHARSALA